jgi:aminocarboxymuconate-semialdehyde decarboxylase
MPNIDIHCHIAPESCLPSEALGLDGKTYGMRIDRNPDGSPCCYSDGRPNMPGCDPEQVYSIDRRLRDMDKSKVDIQLLSNPPFFFFYSVPIEKAAQFHRNFNVAIAKIIKEHPQRFLGLAAVPLQDPTVAAKELEFAVKELGLNGVQISSSLPGKSPVAEETYPFWDMVAKLDVPVYIHPYYVPAETAARLSKYSVGAIIYAPIDVGICCASMIFTGFLDRYPKLKVVFSLGGGPASFLIGRWDHAFYHRGGDCAEGMSKIPSEYLKTLYFETLTYDQPSLEHLVKTVGTSQVVLGTGNPFDMTDFDSVGKIERLQVSQAEREAMLGGNLARLFNLKL